jgi:hypothetical protein
MKNKPIDLHNHLFEQLERLTDDDLDFDKEVKRAQAMCGTAMTIMAGGKLVIKAAKLAAEFPELSKKILLLLE